MPSATERVAAALSAAGLEPRVQELADSTATAAEAAAALGTSVDRIVKSLVFTSDEAPLLVLAAGVNRVDLAKLGRLVGWPVRRADADLVRRATGYAIGGVPPLGLATALAVYVDRDLLQFDEVWAAAGTPHAVFPIAPTDLVRVTHGQVADVKVESA
jgi:prolyl-tRNA editing enzyme YbaK/EbsC (Cys-tRNA(Pro) deacylase)